MPESAKWFLAELLVEITVEGARLNVVHRNLTLVRAETPEEAYEKATYFGRKSETSYENPADRIVSLQFRGISKLDAVIDPIADGAELSFAEFKGYRRRTLKPGYLEKTNLERFGSPRRQGRLNLITGPKKY